MHYVYIYTSNGVPFYVGKGKGRRDLTHLTLAKRPPCDKDSACVKQIRASQLIGEVVAVKRAAEHLTEEAALAEERRLIAHYGRRQTGGLLVNRTSGGQGSCGAIRTPEHRARVSAQFKGKKLSDERRQKTSAWNKANGVRPPLKCGVEHPRAKQFTILLPSGEVQTIHCLKVFCQQHGLNMSSVRNTLYQKRPLKTGPFAGLMIMASP